MSIKLLPSSTVKLIGSSQVVSSISSAVKELMENAIDAGATNIEIRLENYGLDRIEIKDDGSGISVEDIPFMCQRSYTSKIGAFSDLEKLTSYGFRGEALNSLCALGKVTVTTKTKDDKIGNIYFFDTDGRLADSKLSPIVRGTIVVITNIFQKLPVRRQAMENKRKKSEEMRKVEAVVKCLAIIHPNLRVVLSHNKFCIWQKSKVPTLKQSLIQAISPSMVKQLEDITCSDAEIKFDLLIPRKDCNIKTLCFGNMYDTQYLYINSRPVRDRVLDKVIQEELLQFFGPSIPAGKHPMNLVAINLPPNSLDVNLEPNKTKVLVKDMDDLVRRLKKQLLIYYVGTTDLSKLEEEISRGVKRKSGDDDIDFIVVEENENQGRHKVCKTKCSDIGDTRLEEKSDVNTADSEVKSHEMGLKSDKIPPSILQSAKFLNSETIMTDLDVKSPEMILASEKQSESQGSLETIGTKLENSKENSSVCSSKDLETSGFLTLEEESALTQGSCYFSQNEKNVECELSLEDSERELNISRFLEDLPCRTTSENDSNSTAKKENELDGNEIDDDYDSECILASQEVEIVEERKIDSIFKVLKSRTSPFDEKESSHLESVTLSQWSRGEVVLEGKALKGPVAIQGQAVVKNDEIKSSSSATPDPPMEETLKNSVDLQVKSNELSQDLDRSVSSQMGQKEMSGFTKFAREMRAKIIEKIPGISFTKVASELAEHWRGLQDEEKNKYQDIAKNEDRKKLLMKKELESKSKEKQPSLNVKSFQRSEKASLKKKTYNKIMGIELSLEKLKDMICKRCTVELDTEIRLCGTMKEGVYYCKAGTEIGVLSKIRLQEAHIFYKNLSSMAIPLKVLEESIPIVEKDLGDSLWNILSCMETSVDVRCNILFISDERIQKNGFRVEVLEGINGKQFQITDVASHIAFYGLEDLIEILRLIEGSVTKLVECRPLKVISFIRSETIRSLAISRLPGDSVEIGESLRYWLTNIKPVTQNCPHHNPVLQILQ